MTAIQLRKYFKLGSLFTGIGGFDLGFERAGFKTLWQVEIDDDCHEVLSRHFPDAKRFKDVKHVGKDQLASVDCLCFGAPCQDVSVAGKRAGLAGERTGLFYEAARILQELRPSWFVFENVPGLFSSNDGRDFAEVLRVLMVECGYGVSWRVLNSQFFGVAQRRRRVFIVGRFGKPCPAEILFEPARSGRDSETGGEAWENLAATTTNGTERVGSRGADDGADHRFTTDSCVDNLQPVATLNSGGNSGGFRTEPGEHLIAYALRRDPGGTGQGHNTTYAITENMRDRSQGPANYVRSETADSDGVRDFAGLPKGMDSRRYRELGNAVTVNVAEWIARRIVNYMEQS